MSDIDVGSILIGSTASITALHHHLLPRNYLDFYPKLCQQGLLVCCKDASIFTSTAYEGQTPCMCLTLMWDQSWLGLQPQSLHFTIICCPGVTQISRWLVPKAWSMRSAVMLLGHIHIHIHCIWRLSNTLHVSDIDVGSVLIGSTASITALHHYLFPGSYPDF